MSTTTVPKPMTTTIRRLGDLLEAIDLLSTDDSDGVHLSLFSPAGALPEDARQGRIHFSNAIAEAHLRLISTGIDEEVADRLLARPRAILDDEEFWNHQHGGVACFTTEQNCSLLSVGAELPCRGVVSHVPPCHKQRVSLRSHRIQACI